MWELGVASLFSPTKRPYLAAKHIQGFISLTEVRTQKRDTDTPLI